MNEKNRNFDSFNISPSLAEGIKERIAAFYNNRNYYINKVVFDYLKNEHYDVEEPTSFNVREKRTNEKRSNRKRKASYKTMSYKLPRQTVEALADAAERDQRTLPGMLKYIIAMDLKAAAESKENLQPA